MRTSDSSGSLVIVIAGIAIGGTTVNPMGSVVGWYVASV